MRTDGCPVCHRPAGPGFALCFCCGILVRQLRMPLVPVEVATDYRVGDALHRALRGYKDAGVGEARTTYGQGLARHLGAWMADPDGRLARRFGRWNLVVTVPSTQRPSGSPVDALVARVPALARRHRPLLERGPDVIGHLLASRRGFVVRPSVDPLLLARTRALVVDDTITTGARAQSAAAALRLAGARVVGVVALGRALGVVDAASSAPSSAVPCAAPSAPPYGPPLDRRSGGRHQPGEPPWRRAVCVADPVAGLRVGGGAPGG